MHTLETFGKKFTAPSEWSEITLKEILFLIKLMNGGFSYNEVMFRIAVDFFELPEKELSFLKHSRPQTYKDYCLNLLIATETIFDFLFEEIEGEEGKMIVIAKKATNQLLPKYKGFYGPKSSLSNLQIWEFTIAETAFMNFLEKKDLSQLDRLIAVLYRPERSDVVEWRKSDKYDGDDRRPFNDQLIDKDIQLVKNWPAEIKELILIFFFSCREMLPSLFPKIYKNSLKGKTKEKSSWTDIILQQAKSEQKNPEKMSKRKMMIFLRQCEMEIETAEMQQAEIEKIKNKK